MYQKCFLKNAVRIFVVATSVLCVAMFAVSCGGDDSEEPDPVPDKMEVSGVVLKGRKTDEAADKLTYTDAVEVAGKLYTKVGEKTETRDVKQEASLKSEAVWFAGTITVSVLTGNVKSRLLPPLILR